MFYHNIKKKKRDYFCFSLLAFPECGISFFSSRKWHDSWNGYCTNGKPPDSTWSLLAEKRVGGENDSLLNNSIAGTMNKTCKRPRWCLCRIHVEIRIVGSRCVKHFGREWGVINNGQGAAVRTAGETRAVKMAFYHESEVSGAEKLNRMFWHLTCFCKREKEDCVRAVSCRCVCCCDEIRGRCLFTKVYLQNLFIESWKMSLRSWCGGRLTFMSYSFCHRLLGWNEKNYKYHFLTKLLVAGNIVVKS